MLKKRQQDKIGLFCEGKYKYFKNAECQYYFSSDRACRLLREREQLIKPEKKAEWDQKTEEFWAGCRVNSDELLYRAVNRYLLVFKRKYHGIAIDELEQIDFKVIIENIKKQKKEKEEKNNDTNKRRDNLISWIAYINKAVFRAVRHYLHQKYGIPEKRTCGTCVAFSESPPYICTSTGEKRKKTDPPCESYAWKLPPVLAPEPLNEQTAIPDPASENKTEASDNETLPYITNLLLERFKIQAPGSKKREVCKRQYEIFIAFLHELSEIEPESDLNEMIKQRAEIIKQLAETFEVDEKTVRRDIQEVREFFKEKMSLCA